MLTEEELKRYSRSLPLIGKGGQERLKQAKVLVVGVGGLGSPAGLYLAAAGVGILGIVDFDKVEASNLQRQVLHQEEDVGKSKVQSARETLERVNPLIKVVVHPERLVEENAKKIIEGYDVVVDGSDSLETKHLVNKTCHQLGKPLVYGAAIREEGQLAVFTPGKGCLRCLVASPVGGSCAVEGVLPTVPGVIGTLQANEAIKLVLGKPPVQGLVVYGPDGVKTFSFSKRADCPVCGTGNQEEEFLSPRKAQELRAAGKGEFIDVREPFEWKICSIEGSHFIPLGKLEARLGELDKSKRYVTYCHTANRSLEAARFLQKRGFKAQVMKRGITGWAEEIETGMQRY